MSFGELDAAANAMAHAFAPHASHPGDRVAVMMGNSTDAFAVWHGATRLGSLVVPISTRLTESEVAYIVEDSGAALLVHDGSPGAPRGAAAEAGVACLDVTVPALARSLSEGRPEPPTGDFLGTPVIAMTYTSGTTGRPKGIARPAPAAGHARHHRTPSPRSGASRPDDVHLMCGPMYHTAPSAYAFMSLVEGAKVVIMPRWDAASAWAHRGRAGHHRTDGPGQLHPHPRGRLESYDRSNVRKLLHAAAPCPVPVKRQDHRGVPPRHGVGVLRSQRRDGVGHLPRGMARQARQRGPALPGPVGADRGRQGRRYAAGEVGSIYVSVLRRPGFRYHNAPDKTQLRLAQRGLLHGGGHRMAGRRRLSLPR